MRNFSEEKQSEIKQRIVAIDFLRIASLFIIILFHFNVQMIFTRGYNYSLSWSSNKYIDMGQIGVGIFIILSGYSLMHTSIEVCVIDFYKKRLRRIFPIYYISYLVCLLSIVVINSGISFSASPVSFLLTLIGFDGFFNYNVPTFYISGEWFVGSIISMYLIFPIIKFIFMKNSILSFVFVSIIYLANNRLYHIIYTIDEWRNTITLLFLFSFGVFFHTKELESKKIFLFTSIIFSFFYVYLIPSFDVILTKMLICVLIFSSTILLFDAIRPLTGNLHLEKISAIGLPVFLVHHVVIFLVTGKISFFTGITNSYEEFIISLLLSFLLGLFCIKIENLLLNNAVRGK